jgi:hypothetical protein
MLAALWAFLLDPMNRQVLGWAGGGLVTLSGGVWAVLKFRARKRTSGSSSQEKIILARHGGIAAGGNITMGPLTQNFGLDSDAVEQRIVKPVDEALRAIRIELASEKGVDPAVLLPLFEHLGHRKITPTQIREHAAEAIAQMVVLSKRRVEPSNESSDVDAVIGAARQKLAKLDTGGARALLHTKIVEETETYRQRVIPLLTEQAEIELIIFDYGAAQITLKQLVELDPDSVLNWLSLGDVLKKIGELEGAHDAYQSAI